MACLLCGDLHARPFETTHETSVAVRCPACGLVYVDPQPSDEALRSQYSQKACYAGWVDAGASARQTMWARRLRHLFHFTGATLRQILEQARFRVVWQGPDQWAVEPGKRLLDLPAAALHAVTGVNRGYAQEAYATAPKGGLS